VVLADVTRKQAFLAHLYISMAIFVVLLYFIIYQWYPSYYFHIDGGYRGIATIFLVDVVLGPGLTLLLFRPGKPGLKFDMTVIVIFQVVALSWGAWWVYSERPALTVFYDGGFICMKHSEVSEVDLERLDFSDKGPPLLAVLPRPNTYSEYQAMLLEAVRKKSASIYVFGEKFLPMDVVGTVQVLNYTLDVASSLSGDVDQVDKYRKIWADYLENSPAEKSNYMYFPLSCRYGKVLAVFDLEDSRIIDYVPVVTTRAISKIELGFTRKELERKGDNRNNSK
jgi:hypothetical protein